MRFSRWVIIMAVLTLGTVLNGRLVALADDASALNYLIQKVCVNQSGQVQRIDPYNCPAGDKLRALKPGEALPYHKHDQPGPDNPNGFQRHDSYPIQTASGAEMIANPFDFAPFGIFNPSLGDGYDIYLLRNGWVSASETRDGGGFSTTFFGAGCQPYNGWLFFPTSAVDRNGVRPGETEAPIAGNYWEHNGQSWPGSCPSKYADHSGTSWAFIPGFQFGGVNGSPVKTLDTIRSIHGYTAAKFTGSKAAKSHMEVFYFTTLYGVTRWEAWIPQQQAQQDSTVQQRVLTANTKCGGPFQNTYKGITFVRADCRDWSAVTPEPATESVTVWPIPDLNLLQNYHFSDDFSSWQRTGTSVEGRPMNGQHRYSLATKDSNSKFLQPGGKGVSYVAINCGGTCNANEALSQSVPITESYWGHRYTVLATIRSEQGDGTVALRLAELDGQGKVLTESISKMTVPDHQGAMTGDISILRSATMIYLKTPVKVASGAKTLRVSVSPITPGTFDMTDVWLLEVPSGS